MEINTTEHNQEYQFQLRLKLLILLHQVTSKKVRSVHQFTCELSVLREMSDVVIKTEFQIKSYISRLFLEK